MTDSLLLRNVLLWSLQILALTGFAAILSLTFRRSMPSIRLLFLQITLLICLLLPFLRTSRPPIIVTTAPSSAYAVTAVPHTAQPAVPAFSVAEIVLAMLLAGSLLRLLLMLTGLWRLSRYRHQSDPLPILTPWASEAGLRLSHHIKGPVTFGFRKPIVLLPPDFPTLAEPMQDAILCHEILHVRRHDWLFTIAEEFVRALFWFHPAIWWLLHRIQLAREEAVDREAIEMTRQRDAYIDALLITAGASQHDLAPAPLFLRKRHLRQRIASILKELPMSKSKSISVLAVSLTALITIGWIAAGALPLRAAPESVTDAAGVSVDTRGAPLMHRASVPYPPEAISKGIQGTVIADAKLDSTGEVTDATIVSGPDELRKAVLQSLLNWHFAPGPDTREITVTFTAPKSAATPAAAVPRLFAAARDSQILSVEVAGLSDQAQQELLNRISVHAGDTLTAEKYNQLVAAVQAFDTHLRVAVIPITASNHSVIQIFLPGASDRANGMGVIAALAQDQLNAGLPFPPAPPSTPPSDQTPAVPSPIRVGQAVQAANLINNVAPVYPPLAKAAHVQGTVEFQATIGTDGAVKNLQLVSGPPLLVRAAMDAAKQWTYKPTLLNGSPVDVITTIDINFTLDQ